MHMGLDNVWDKDTNLCGAQIRKDKSQSERHLLEKSGPEQRFSQNRAIGSQPACNDPSAACWNARAP
jgi:hypothetical protein